MLPSHLERFKTFLRENHLKVTPERLAVLEAAFLNESHFEAEDLLIQMRRRGIQVSKATIYRTLPLLVKSGLLREVITGERHTHYETMVGRQFHDHMICQNCGRILEFENEDLEKSIQRVCEQYGFEMVSRIVEIRGICRECREVAQETTPRGKS